MRTLCPYQYSYANWRMRKHVTFSFKIERMLHNLRYILHSFTMKEHADIQH